MPAVTNELMYELLKRVHSRMDRLDHGLSEVQSELVCIRGCMASMRNDIHNVCGVLGRHDARIERIDRRLELRTFAEPQHPFEPHP